MITSLYVEITMALYSKIEGFPNYVIRSDGYVINIKRGREMKNCLHTHSKTGYQKYQCGLYHEGKQKNFTVSVLLAKAFIPGQSEERNSVDHKDQNSLNNNLSNLRWATKSEQGINRTQPLGDLNEKNISKHGNGYRFEICRNGIKHSKTFKTLEESIIYRDEYLTRLGEK